MKKTEVIAEIEELAENESLSKGQQWIRDLYTKDMANTKHIGIATWIGNSTGIPPNEVYAILDDKFSEDAQNLMQDFLDIILNVVKKSR